MIQSDAGLPAPKTEPDIMAILAKILFRLDEIEVMLEEVDARLRDIDLPPDRQYDD